MKIYEVNERDGVTVLAIRGRLDAVRVGTIREGVVGLTGQGNLQVVLDLSGLKRIKLPFGGGAAGHALQAGQGQGRQRGGRVPARQPQEIFRLLRLESAFKVYDAVDDAVAAARA